MTDPFVRLGSLIRPAKVNRAGARDLPILSMTMSLGLVDQSDKFKKRVASRDTSIYKVVKSGQLVVGFPIDEGVLAFQEKYDEAIVSPAYEIWDLSDSTRVDRAYLEKFLRSPRSLAYYSAKLQGTTARRRSLPKDVFLDLPVVLPDLSHQRKVVHALMQVETLREKRREAIRLLDELAQSVYLDTFGNPAINPFGWPIKRVGDLVESVSYGTSAKASLVGTIPVLRMNNITSRGEIDLQDLKYMDRHQVSDRHTVKSGDILFNRTNSPDLVGKTAIYRAEEPLAYAGYLIRVRANRNSHPEYLAAFLNTAYAKRVLRGMCKSIVGMANINAKELQAVRIPEPPISLQEQFAKQVSSIESAKAAHRSHLRLLESLFVSMQYQCFRPN